MVIVPNTTMSTNRSTFTNTSSSGPPYDLQYIAYPNYRTFITCMLILNSVVAIVVVVLNFIVILTFITTSCIRSSKNILVLGLAISDLLMGIFAQPCFCVHLYAMLTYDLEIAFISETIFFIVFTFLSFVTLGILTAITFDRFLALKLHLRYNELVTVKRNSIGLISIWIGSFILCLIRLAVNSDYMASIDIFLFVFALILNGFFLLRIAQCVRRHAAQIHAQSTLDAQINMPRYKKSVKTMHLISAAFVGSYCPHVVALTYLLIVQEWNMGISYMFTMTVSVMMLNGAINPVIYCWRVGEIQTALYALIRKIFHL